MKHQIAPKLNRAMPRLKGESRTPHRTRSPLQRSFELVRNAYSSEHSLRLKFHIEGQDMLSLRPNLGGSSLRPLRKSRI